MKKWVKAGLLSLAGVLVLTGGLVAWTVETHAGTEWLAGVLSGRLGGEVRFAALEGKLAGPLTLKGLRFQDPRAGIAFSAGRLLVDIDLAELFEWRVHIKNVEARDVRLALQPVARQTPSATLTDPLRPPLNVVLDQLTLSNATLVKGGQTELRIRTAFLAASWTRAAGLLLRRLELDTSSGTARLDAQIQKKRAPDRYLGYVGGRFDWTVAKTKYAGVIQGQADGTSATLRLDLTVPAAVGAKLVVRETPSWPWQLDVKVPLFDPAKILPISAINSLGAHLTGTGDLHAGEMTGTLLVNSQRLRLETLRLARATGEPIVVRSLQIGSADGRMQIDAHGRLALAAGSSADLSVRWRGLTIPVRSMGSIESAQGSAQIEGTPGYFRIQGGLEVGTAHVLPARIAVDVSGTPRRLEVQQLRIGERPGKLTAHGIVQLEPVLAWNLTAAADQFDPGRLYPPASGALNFNLTSSGRLVHSFPQGQVSVSGLRGWLGGRAISGYADLRTRPDGVAAGSLALRSGRSVLSIRGGGGRQMDLVVTMAVEQLSDWIPGGAGSFNARVRARGHWPDLSVRGWARGRDLILAKGSVQHLGLRLDVTNLRRRAGSISVNASGLAAASMTWRSLRLSAAGNLHQHTVRLEASGSPVGFQLRLQGSASQNAWHGTLEELALDVTRAGHFGLRRPAAIEVTPRAFALAQTCLEGQNAQLCLSGKRQPDGLLQGEYRLSNVSLPLFTSLLIAQSPLSVEGVLDGRGDVIREPDGAVHAVASLSAPSGRILSLAQPGTVLLSYQNVTLRASANGDSGHLAVNGSFGNDGGVSGAADFRGLLHAPVQVQGSVNATLTRLAPVAAFMPRLVNVQGQLAASARVNGTVVAPHLVARVDVEHFGTELPALGVKLADGSIRLEKNDAQPGTLSGTVRSGSGELSFHGAQIGPRELGVDVQGHDFQVVGLAGAQVAISPDLHAQGGPGRVNLVGKVVIPTAHVDLTKLPQGIGGRPSVSPDIVVVDEPRLPTRIKGPALPLDANVTMVMGGDVHLVGFGLAAQMLGQIDVYDSPGSPAVGSGQLRVQGTYKAYGQDLTIEHGNLLFARTPLNNPRLDIAAYRPLLNQNVRPKLLVTGTAQHPILSVSADPPMSEADALAYLVTGHSMNASGTQNASALQTAAHSLGAAAGNLVAKNVGSRLGISTLGVQNSQALGGSAFTVGQYLTPRLFLSYGIGVFTPGQVVTLRLRLTRHLQLRAVTASTETLSSLDYEIGRSGVDTSQIDAEAIGADLSMDQASLLR